MDDVVDTAAAAQLVGLSQPHLSKLRCLGGGPEYIKLGRRVVYQRGALEVWLAAHTRARTSRCRQSGSERRSEVS